MIALSPKTNALSRTKHHIPSPVFGPSPPPSSTAALLPPAARPPVLADCFQLATVLPLWLETARDRRVVLPPSKQASC